MEPLTLEATNLLLEEIMGEISGSFDRVDPPRVDLGIWFFNLQICAVQPMTQPDRSAFDRYLQMALDLLLAVRQAIEDSVSPEV